MLKAFQKRLMALAKGSDENFENHVKKRWGKALPKGLLEDLKAFVLMLPEIESRIYLLYVELPKTSEVKDVGGHFLAYMYQADDFLPENEQNGLFGYLDDAYLAALFYELMLEEIERAKQFRLPKKDKELLRKAIRLKKKARAVIPEEAIQIKEMMAGLFEGDAAIYNKLFKEKTHA